MSGGKSPRIPLPKHWTKHVRSAVLHVISLAQYAAVYREGRDETVRLKSTKVQRRAELADRTKPAIFVGAISGDAKKD